MKKWKCLSGLLEFICLPQLILGCLQSYAAAMFHIKLLITVVVGLHVSEQAGEESVLTSPLHQGQNTA